MNDDESRLREIAREFEIAWSAQHYPKLDEFLKRVSEAERPALALLLVPIDNAFRAQLRQEPQEIKGRTHGHPSRDSGTRLDSPGEDHSESNEHGDSISSGTYELNPAESVRMAQTDFGIQVQASQFIGPYKLLQAIGEGGMGSVWMAQQDRPVRRKVALKLIKTGMDSKQIIGRFEAERQALAMMDHQNIAKVLDAGETTGGLPYFVMELVQGIPFTRYCDSNRLSIRERLELFLPVCAAVQHAHQKGIIHRDIKPGNILVTLYDGKPVPKIIDFGLAKALQHQTHLTDKTMFTEFGQVVGTLQYMSPEQAEMNALDIDTRTDIYSLGVMLYELLTGSTPIERESLRKEAILRVLQTIREADPPRPSARLSSANAKTVSGISDQRRIDPGRLSQILRGDLDWIVMKALDKDRTRRYDSPLDLAADIRRHLQSEPVQARPPSTMYLIRRFVTRNRAAVTTAALIVAGLIVSLLAVSVLLVREANARAIADKSAAKSGEVATFLKEMLATVSPSSAQGKDVSLLREILDAASDRMGKDLLAYPDVEADLRWVIARTYDDISEFQKSLEMNLAVLNLFRTRLPNDHVSLSRALYGVSCSYERLDDLPEAESAVREAIDIREKWVPSDPVMLARDRGHLAWLLFRQDRLVEAGEECEESLKMIDVNHPDAALTRVNILNVQAAVCAKATRFQQSVEVQRQVVDQVRQINGEMHLRYVSSLNNLCQGLVQTGEFDEAVQIATQTLEIQKKMTGKPVGQNTHSLLKAIALVHLYRGEFPQAIPLLQQAIDAATEIYGPVHRFTIDKRAMLIRAQVAAGRLEDAAETLRLVRELGSGLSADNSLEVAAALLAIAQGDFETAEREAEKEIERIRKIGGTPSLQLANALQVRAQAHFGKGQLPQAVAVIREAISILNPGVNQGTPLLSAIQSDLIRFLRAINAEDPEASRLEAALKAK